MGKRKREWQRTTAERLASDALSGIGRALYRVGALSPAARSVLSFVRTHRDASGAKGARPVRATSG